jgi:hypothetical protein
MHTRDCKTRAGVAALCTSCVSCAQLLDTPCMRGVAVSDFVVTRTRAWPQRVGPSKRLALLTKPASFARGIVLIAVITRV